MAMRRILETEEYVEVPPAVYADPFYRISYLMKEEIRKYKWFEGEKGRKLTWERARQEWTDAHRQAYEKYLIETLSFPDPAPLEELPTEEAYTFATVNILAKLPLRSGG